jgi:Xaa-Pro dipeptidase
MQLTEIQNALREEKLDGWLFFDHHQRDPLAYRILHLNPGATATRRWYYFIPATGEPRALVHRIESGILDTLPGQKQIYSGWTAQTAGLQWLLSGSKTVAMQYSPLCAIPYVSMVDGGTVELVRQAGVEVVTSANLVQLFEARWSGDQLESHLEAGKRVDRIRAAAFNKIANDLRNAAALTEWDVNRFIRSAFETDGMITDHGPIVAVNANMSDPHYEPSADRHQPIKRGDCVLIDMWAKLNQPQAVYYDITWTGFAGAQPPAEFLNIFNVTTTARDKAVERVQTGIRNGQTLHGFEVDDAARGYIAEKGFAEYFVHRTGHSIGEEVHGTGANMDNLETHDERRLISRTCFSVEPGVYLPQFGVRSEVNVFVGDADARVTGEIQRELVLLV